jgi:hypothetical protein
MIIQFLGRETDSTIIGLIQRNITTLAQKHKKVVSSKFESLLTTVTNRLKGKELSHEGRVGIIGCVRAALPALDKEVALKTGKNIFALFDKYKDSKESLSLYQLLGGLYPLVSGLGLDAFSANVDATCEELVKAASSKVELKVKKTIIECFGPVLALRKQFSTSRLLKVLEILHDSLALEALHFSCIHALEHLRDTPSAKADTEIDNSVNRIIQKLLELFATKNRLYQVGIVRVLEGILRDSSIKLSEANEKAILQTFSSLMEKIDVPTSKIIINFLLSFEDRYKKYSAEIGKLLQTMRVMVSASNADDEYLQLLVSGHKSFLPAADYASTINKIYDTMKKDPNTEVSQSSLFLYFLFRSLPNLEPLFMDIAQEIISKRSANLCLSLSLLGHLGYIKDMSKEERLMTIISDAINNKEATIKFNAIKCLTGLATNSLGNFKPILNASIAKNVENRMFFFTSVQQIFDYLSPDVPRECVSQFLAYLLDFVEVIEEGERADLFKAFGKVLRNAPETIEEVYKKLSAQNKPLYSLLGVTACKQIFDRQLDLENYPTVREMLIKSIDSVNPDVETGAFVSLDAIHCSNPKTVEKLLNLHFCNIMAKKMLVDQSLVEKIEMGMFSHKIDNGLKLRKACFSFLFRLCKSEIFSIQPFIQAVIAGIGDENEDVRYLATRIVREGIVGQGHSFLLTEFTQELVASLEKSLKAFKFKSATIVQEKGANYQSLKSLVGLIDELAKSQEFSSQASIKALQADVQNTPALKDVLGSN